MAANTEIDGDMAAPERMLRLLQGDVGSGKTIVALLALATAVECGAQGAFMAPTEILARQHFASLSPLCDAAGIAADMDLVAGCALAGAVFLAVGNVVADLLRALVDPRARETAG